MVIAKWTCSLVLHVVDAVNLPSLAFSTSVSVYQLTGELLSTMTHRVTTARNVLEWGSRLAGVGLAKPC